MSKVDEGSVDGIFIGDLLRQERGTSSEDPFDLFGWELPSVADLESVDLSSENVSSEGLWMDAEDASGYVKVQDVRVF